MSGFRLFEYFKTQIRACSYFAHINHPPFCSHPPLHPLPSREGRQKCDPPSFPSPLVGEGAGEGCLVNSETKWFKKI